MLVQQTDDIAIGRKIGKKSGRGASKYAWCACIDCGEERWVRLVRGEPRNTRCRRCIGAQVGVTLNTERANWKGGKRYNAGGYVLIWLRPSDFFNPMAMKGGDALEHRLIMAKHLGRCLLSWEVSHHINGVRDDNRLENLLLLTRSDHRKLHIKMSKEG